MELLLYGDATFEMMRGSLDGEPNERADEGPEIFSSYFSSWTSASVFGMAGHPPPPPPPPGAPPQSYLYDPYVNITCPLNPLPCSI